VAEEEAPLLGVDLQPKPSVDRLVEVDGGWPIDDVERDLDLPAQ
jgi:hypothetical protein